MKRVFIKIFAVLLLLMSWLAIADPPKTPPGGYFKRVFDMVLGADAPITDVRVITLNMQLGDNIIGVLPDVARFQNAYPGADVKISSPADYIVQNETLKLADDQHSSAFRKSLKGETFNKLAAEIASIDDIDDVAAQIGKGTYQGSDELATFVKGFDEHIIKMVEGAKGKGAKVFQFGSSDVIVSLWNQHQLSMNGPVDPLWRPVNDSAEMLARREQLGLAHNNFQKISKQLDQRFQKLVTERGGIAVLEGGAKDSILPRMFFPDPKQTQAAENIRGALINAPQFSPPSSSANNYENAVNKRNVFFGPAPDDFKEMPLENFYRTPDQSLTKAFDERVLKLGGEKGATFVVNLNTGGPYKFDDIVRQGNDYPKKIIESILKKDPNAKILFTPFADLPGYSSDALKSGLGVQMKEMKRAIEGLEMTYAKNVMIMPDDPKVWNYAARFHADLVLSQDSGFVHATNLLVDEPEKVVTIFTDDHQFFTRWVREGQQSISLTNGGNLKGLGTIGDELTQVINGGMVNGRVKPKFPCGGDEFLLYLYSIMKK